MPVNPSVINLADLNGSNGFKIVGAANGDYSGFTVSEAGDINGDGIDDFLVSADGGFNSPTINGAAYVVFGTTNGFGDGFGTLDLSTINGSNGFQITGADSGDRLGYSVSAAGDVNGDGFDDLIVGAAYADIGAGDTGAAYVVFGSNLGFLPTITPGDLTGTNGFRISGGLSGDYIGSSVAAAGDINGDGIDDIIVGARGTDAGSSDEGAAYVIFGSLTPFASDFAISSLTGSNGFRIAGESGDGRLGISVSGGGDFNGDGFDDLIVGAHRLTGGQGNYEGAAYVIFGTDGGFSGNLGLSSLTAAQGFQIHAEDDEDRLGISVSNAGDVNGDGFADLVVGAHLAEAGGTERGASYVVFGSASSFGADFNLTALNGMNGFEIKGVADDDWAGYSVSGAGDVNGDGFADLIIGARRDFFATPAVGPGASYVVFGKAGGFGSVVNLSALDGTNGFRINGIADQDYSGGFVSGAGDVNNDGFDDVVIGAWGAAGGGTNRGESYVVFGRATGTLNRTFTDASEVIGGGDWDDVLIGLGGDDTINGGAGDDQLDGGADDDVINGGDGDDTIIGGAGSDNINGGTGDDTIKAGSGDDYVFLGEGADDLNGGSGNFDYLDVQGFFGSGGTVNFLTGLAFMTGSADVSKVLGFENVTGSGGNDTMIGNSAANQFYSGGGNDTLDGGLGADLLQGDAGNDTYVLGAESDTVVETTGIDTITSTITRSLAGYAAIENLTLLGTAAANGTGNALLNVIIGNAAVNVLNGGTDAFVDQLRGGLGNDVYVMNNAVSDAITDTGGIDTVLSSFTRTLALNIERLTLTGSGAITGTGNSLANVITGNTGLNVLVGGLGIDTLNGGGVGQDRFRFNALAECGDSIQNFDVNDFIQLKATAFLGLTAANKAANFVIRAVDNLAQDAADRLVFRQSDDTLWYDSNGSGAGGLTKIADLSNNFNMTAADILIV